MQKRNDSFKVGQEVNEIFGIELVEHKQGKQNQAYVRLELTHQKGKLIGWWWQPSPIAHRLKVGMGVRITGSCQMYQQKLQLSIRSVNIEPQVDFDTLLYKPSKVLVDLLFLTRQNPKSLTVRELESNSIYGQKAYEPSLLSPLACVLPLAGLFNPQTSKGVVLYVGKRQYQQISQTIRIERCTTEEELLTHLWRYLESYEVIVSLSGRRFVSSLLHFRTLANHLNVPFRIDSKLKDYSTLIRPYSLPHYSLEEMLKAFALPTPHNFIRELSNGQKLQTTTVAKKAVVGEIARLEALESLYAFFLKHLAVGM